MKPDFTLYLDLDPKIGLARAKGRGELDRIEQQEIAFFERTRLRYFALTQDNPYAIVIDVEQPIEQVSADIRQAVEIFLKSAK